MASNGNNMSKRSLRKREIKKYLHLKITFSEPAWMIYLLDSKENLVLNVIDMFGWINLIVKKNLPFS